MQKHSLTSYKVEGLEMTLVPGEPKLKVKAEDEDGDGDEE